MSLDKEIKTEFSSSKVKIPHSISVEKSVLSSLFQYEDLPEEGTINDHIFFSPAHKIIYFELNQMGRPVDIVKLTQRLIDNGKIGTVGGPSAIVEIYTFQPTSSYFPEHLKLLHRYAARRSAITAANELLVASYDLSDEEAYIELTRTPMEAVAEIAEAASPSRSRDDIVETMIQNFAERVKNKDAVMGWPTGMVLFDDQFKGIHPKRIYIIGGYPTSGKTVMAIQVLWNIAINATPTLMISLEMPADKIAERNMVIASGLKADAITDPHAYANMEGFPTPTKGHLDQIRKAAVLVRNTPIYYEDPTGARLATLLILIRKHVKKHGVKVVAVDYIQLIIGPKTMNKEQELATISHAFQSLAKELNIAIILLSQQNKEGGTKYAEAVNEDADCVISILQVMDKESIHYRKHTGIGIRKDRHGGGTGGFLDIILDKDYLIFRTQHDKERITQ